MRDRKNELVKPLRLVGTRYLASLDGKVWEKESEKSTGSKDLEDSFSPQERIDFKRSKLQISIILKESDSFGKFELFQRLNTGGSQASDQEVRNCMLVDVNEDFYSELLALSTEDNFSNCAGLSDRLVDQQYGLELVLRFMVFRRIGQDQLKTVRNMGDFISARMLEMAEDPKFDLPKEMAAFRDTFAFLFETLGENCMRKYVEQSRSAAGLFRSLAVARVTC